MMFTIILSAIVGLAFGQQRTCEYEGGPNGRYTLNLTSISGYRLEYQTSNFFYYYTPCRNGERCTQGNADFYSNCVQYRPGENTCNHYLSVDHYERPEYIFGTAAWAFRYEDGEKCDQTQQPRDLNVYYLCDENFQTGAYIADVYEPESCRYTMQIRTPLACVPESSHNSNCQWRYRDNQNNTYSIDLSSERGNIYRSGQSNNGYEMFYSPCQNGLHCYQQTGDRQVMSILENDVTRTCEKYLAEWQDGRVQPIFHNSNPDEIHWSYHYYLSEKCNNGQPGEETIRWYCDNSAENATIINMTYDGDCRHEINMASALACPTNKMYSFDGDINLMDMKPLYEKFSNQQA